MSPFERIFDAHLSLMKAQGELALAYSGAVLALPNEATKVVAGLLAGTMRQLIAAPLAEAQKRLMSFHGGVIEDITPK